MSGGVESPLSPSALRADSSSSSLGASATKKRQPLNPNRATNGVVFKRQKSGGHHYNNHHHHRHHTKFAQGGSISDPLNLNGLMKERNVATKRAIETPHRSDNVVNLILRPNIKDPLNLEGTYDLDNANLLTSSETPKKRSKVTKDDLELQLNSNANLTRAAFEEIKKNISKRRRAHSFTVASSSTSAAHIVSHFNRQKSAPDSSMVFKESVVCASGGVVDEICVGEMKVVCVVKEENFGEDLKDKEKEKDKERKTVKIDEKPPVEIGASEKSVAVANNNVKFDKNGFRFRFGNYNRYYGYRNPANESDARLVYLRQDWFASKAVLDIGCNVGHVTLHIASTFAPSRVVGIDIDGGLIKSARNNIRHYMPDANRYPKSFAVTYGGLMSHLSEAIEPSTSNTDPNPNPTTNEFPKNVQFIQGDYVPKSGDELEKVECEYDFIMALSITKWIHLNNGDEGLKRFFQKVYRNLNAGGSFLVEPQSWQSYKKKAKLCKDIWKTYHEIKFKPNEFKSFLLSSEVGFASCKTIATPNNKSKGFRRPMFLFTKQ